MIRKNYKIIELYEEKTGDVVRTLRFYSEKDFFYFLDRFKQMRYPGYRWRALKKANQKKKQNETEI
jgi:hypothetical protein